MISPAEIRAEAAKLGLEVVGVLSIDTLRKRLRTESERLAKWQSQGRAAEMRYMERPPELFTTLENFLPNVRTVATFSLSYLQGPRNLGPCPPGKGRVARYAWGLDYHTVIRSKLEELVTALRRIGNFDYRLFSDSVPLLERAIAAAGELGFIGKNTLLIRPGVGSFTFLAEALFSFECEELPETHRGDGCGSCFRCAAHCPTGAIVSPYELDSSKCISYLSIEKRTAFEDWEASALGEWIFGCDICQEVCPFNNEMVERSEIEEFRLEKGVGPFLNLDEILSIREDAAYRVRFRGTPILRAKREQLVRNACAVVANTGQEQFAGLLRAVSEKDPSELARSSARQALEKLAQNPS